MSDQLPVLCRQCGSYSSDRDWCEQCGADLNAQERPKDPEWLKPGDVLCFKGIAPERLPEPEVTATTDHDFAASRQTQQTSRVTIPLPEELGRALVEDAPEPREVAPTEATPPGSVAIPDEAIPPEVEDALSEAQLDDAEVDADDEDLFDTAIVEEADEGSRPLDGLFEAIGPGTDTDTDTDPSSDEAPVSMEVEILGPREVYSRRRIWLSRQTGRSEDIDEVHFLVEERQLEAEEAAELDTGAPDALESTYLYPALSRMERDARVLSLFQAPAGQSLFSWRQRQPNPRYSSILSLLRPLVEAVEALHDAQRLHLNLAPQNIWFHQGDISFTGVETFAQNPLDERQVMVRSYPGFSAPELFGRSRQEIGAATDIYGLGAVIYYLITGIVPPVAPETAFAPAISPRDFQPSFPLGWVDAVLQATDPVAERRQSSARVLLDQLEAGAELMRQRIAPPSGLRLLAAAERHIGFAKQRRSPINQDNIFIAHNESRGRMLIVVGDGVSTASFGSGDLASAFLTKRAEEHWQILTDKRTLGQPEQVIADIIYDANRDIVDYVNSHHAPINGAPSEVMGSTALVALIEDNTLHLGSLGDSRCYLIRDEVMECVTRDHNLFTLSLIEGISINEVLMMPHGDALARCLGTFDLKPDGTLHAINPPFDFYSFGLLPDDNILLCTDGLFDYAGATYEESERNIRRIVLGEPHPGIACLELILLANRGGGGDNIGVACLKVREEA